MITINDLLNEALKRKLIVRDGKRKYVKRSDKEGYTVKDGREVKMSQSERRKRKLSQRKGARKRKVKSKTASRKRKISMRKR